MLHFALIGEHLGHSLSAPIHTALYQKLGLNADYRLIEIPRNGFNDRVRQLFTELNGFNVTIPYKQDVIPLLSHLDAFASSIGAVNTVICGNGSASGANTDAPGFAAMLRFHQMDPAGKPCYVLGTGGASKAIVAALQSMNAANVTLVSRHARPGVITYEELPDVFSGYLINTTPAGMWPDVGGCPLSTDILETVLRKADGVADIIYNPAETMLTAAARKAGVPACTGMHMLIAQAVEAEKHWLRGIDDIPDNMTEMLAKELKLL